MFTSMHFTHEQRGMLHFELNSSFKSNSVRLQITDLADCIIKSLSTL